MSSTGRPRSPPLALTSSRQSWSAIRSCLPFCATPPVIAMLKPTLIGSAANAGACSESSNSAAAATAARQKASMGTFPDIRLSPAVFFETTVTLFHHLVARHDAPQIGGARVLGPHFRPLRIVTMPRPRLEIAKFLIHL